MEVVIGLYFYVEGWTELTILTGAPFILTTFLVRVSIKNTWL